jgi:uncharacterized membrane protein YphA (DoxX/SURF4 family)
MDSAILKHLISIGRIVLGAVFVYAGVVKFTDITTFAGSIAAYRILPYFGNYLLASILPCLEIICGVILITGWRIRAAAVVIALLNVVFIVALLSASVRGLDIDCGCFRPGSKTPPMEALIRDLIFLVMALIVLWQDWRSSAANRPS